MMYTHRRWSVRPVASPEVLAQMLTERTWTLCAGFYVAGVTFIDRRVPPHLRSTGQTLFNGATFGLGSVAGSNLFGVLFDQLHPGGMYLVAATLCALSVVGLALFLPNMPANK